MAFVPRALHTAVSNERLFAVAAVVALVEGIVRYLLMIGFDPVVAILWPPIVAVVGLGWAVPAIASESDPQIPIDRPGNGAFWRRLPALAVVAVVGHALAVVGGVMLFVLVDTPIKYVLYWLRGDALLGPQIMVWGPLFGIFLGTLTAWVVPAISVASAATGKGTRASLRWLWRTPLVAPRQMGRAVWWQFILVVLAGLATVSTVVAIPPLVANAARNGSLWVLAILGFSGSLVFAVVFGAALAFAVGFIGNEEIVSSRSWTVPIAPVVLSMLLLTALVATAGAVRVTETRPMDTEPMSLPDTDQPDDLYETAVENTDRADHEFRYFTLNDPEQSGPAFWTQIDRSDRQVVQSMDADRPTSYYSQGGLFQGLSGSQGDQDRSLAQQSRIVPAYALMAQGDGPGKIGELRTNASNWTVQEQSSEQVTLTLSESDDVFAAYPGGDIDSFADSTQELVVHESWSRVTVDTDREVVSHGEHRLNITTHDGDGAIVQEYNVHIAYEYDVDIDVDRPAELGSPSIQELAWRFAAY